MALGAPSGTGQVEEERRAGWCLPAALKAGLGSRLQSAEHAVCVRNELLQKGGGRLLWTVSACAEGTAPALWDVLQPPADHVVRQGEPTRTHQAGGEASVDLRNQGLDATARQLRQDLLCGQGGS